MKTILAAVLMLVAAGCGSSPREAKTAKQPAMPDLSGMYPGLVPLTPKEQAESAKRAKEMEADNARLMAVSLAALIPVLKEKGYSKPDDTTVVGGPGDTITSFPGESFLLGACLGSDGKPHALKADFTCTKFGKEYTVSLREVTIDNETVWEAR